ncbi:Ig-like domain-containing protein [Haloferax sp. AB510]|uniref:Ig-like domain-containing protein n=1 Tax=Haloferax sp. AB510 TaxID=2934172 RepID=UPI00209BC05B|nr:Ig-like domain-containing protein [Haloferax sp. AB510]MCO8265348.1 Ig-like domain-containing protein [Haloferax sp. AB510]
MELLDSERGQAVQVGAILLFGFLVIGLSLYQATVVPQQTKATEFGAYLDASDDLVSLHNDVLATATRGVQSGVTVQTGVQYRPRVVFINPGPPTGSLTLTDSRDITIAGADAVDGEPEAVRTLWDGGTRTYESKVLRYSPDYNEFDGTPITVSGAAVQREAGANVVPLGGQTLVSGNRITAVSIDGRIGQTAARTPLTVAPISSATRTVTVTNESDEDITLTLPVGSNATAWSRSPTADRMLENARVKAVSDLGDGADPTNSLVRVTLNGSYTYELRLAKVELSSSSAASTVASPDGQYLVPVTTGAAAAPDKSTEVVVEARDRYNNPVEGELIDFTVTEGDASPTSRTVTTTDDGRAGFAFTPAADADGPITVRASGDLDGDGTVEAIEQTTYTVPLVNGSGSGGGTGAGDDGSTGEINPPQEDQDVILTGATATNGNDAARISLNNTGTERVVTSFRVSFYYPDQGGNGAETASFNGSPAQNVGADQYTLGPDRVTLPSDATTDITIDFGANKNLDTRGDFFILTVQFDDGEFATYFVAVP